MVTVNEQDPQLGKLSTETSEESLERFLTTLWKTRKTGLRSPEKSEFQSLLNLSSAGELHTVLATIRSLIRKFVHEELNDEELAKLFPPDFSCNLRTVLIQILHKHKDSWKHELSQEQHLVSWRRESFPARPNFNQSIPSFPSSENSISQCARQEDPLKCLRRNSSLEGSTSRQDAKHPDGSEIIPSFKSITWTVENPDSVPRERVATVSLKLQDSTKLTSEESEVKFKLSRDVLESTLRSMIRIQEKFSSVVDSSSGSVGKKQKR